MLNRIGRNPRWVSVLNIAGMALACVLFAALRWDKLQSLVNADPALWLFQMGRAASGELPYRDFAWNYPPLTIWFFAAFLKLFGVTFAAAQVAIDLLSVAVVVLSYWLLSYLLPQSLRLAVILCLIAIGATAQTKFTLFSFLAYSPSLHFATIGLLMVMIGAVRYLRMRSLRWTTALLISGGAFISQTAKPESLLASCCLLILVAIVDRLSSRNPLETKRWFVRHALLFAGSTLPAVAAYAWEARRAGLDNLKAGVSGYGLATFACPWWPTGLGVYGALASLAEAVLIAALVSLPLWRQFSAKYGRRYRIGLVCAVPCALLYLSYYWYINRDDLSGAGSLLQTVIQGLPLLFWTSPVLLPVMWLGVCYCSYYGYRMVTGQLRTATPQTLELFVVLAAPVIMSSRGLFGTTLYPWTEVSAVCYPFFAILGPVLLWRWLRIAAPEKSALIVATVVLLYAGIRVAGGYSTFLSDRNYTTVATEAGAIRLFGDDGSAAIYRYVVEHTGPQDTVLDIPYGGGVNFAAHRPSPVFTTEFEQLRPTPAHQQRDLEGLARHKPKVIIADDRPAFGTFFGWREKMECPCPKLVWQPDRLSGDPNYTFPFVLYIQQHYRVHRKIAKKLILVPK